MAIGFLFLGWYLADLNVRLQRSSLKPTRLQRLFPFTSTMRRIILSHMENQRFLEQELAMWKHICHVAPIGFLYVDRENHLIRCNPKACQLLDIQQCQHIPPRLLLELVRSYELDQLIEQTRKVGQHCEREWIFHPVSAEQAILSQQQPRPMRGYGLPLADGAVGVFLENRQEATLLAQQRDRWTSDVAHELKTPLTSIRLVAETLQTRLEPPLRTWVDRLLHETIRLSGLVQDLLDLSHLQASPTARLTKQPVDLVKLIQSAWQSLEPLARKKNLQLHYSGPSSLVILADEPRLHRVLLNVFDNSIKYSSPEQEIRVCMGLTANTTSTTQQVHLEVIDAGPGFPESALPHVFERFYQADPSRTRSGYELGMARQPDSSPPSSSEPAALMNSSCGLGLAIVRQIVEAHQGSVTAGNHPATGGAWLQIFLPWKPSEAVSLESVT
nr:HAMP domain-containing sensor histidine kinase [Leptolyngbya sp. FACHB-36]